MKITHVEATILRQETIDTSRADGGQDTLLVQIEADSGLVGFGEVDSSPEVAKAFIDAPASHSINNGLRNLLLGHEVNDLNETWERLYRGSIYAGRRGAGIHALSGIDMALWDLQGKSLGVPVGSLLGPKIHDEIKAYASVLMPSSPTDVSQLVERLSGEGYLAIKLGWGVIGQDRETDVSLICAAREAAGDNIELMLDAGYGYGRDIEEAAFISSVLHDYDFSWLEEPFFPDEIDAYSKLRIRSKTPIAGGEQNATRWEFKELARMEAMDIWQPDVSRCGGISELMQIADLADQHGVRVIPHAWKSGILKAASLHVNSVMGGQRIQEWCTAENPLARDLVSTDQTLKAGYAGVPTTPGIGVEIDQSVIDKYRLHETKG